MFLAGLFKGHQSKVTASMATDITTNVMMRSAQNCVSVASGTNSISIDGDYNNLTDVAQGLSLSVDTSCPSLNVQDSDFQATIRNATAQAIEDKTIALTQFLDNSSATIDTKITNSLSTNVTKEDVKNCLSNLNGINNIAVRGDGNVLAHVAQTMSINAVSPCVAQNTQTAKSVVDITNTANQHEKYTSENPFSFIGDALNALAKSFMAIAAVIFIILIGFVVIMGSLGKMGSGPHKNPSDKHLPSDKSSMPDVGIV